MKMCVCVFVCVCVRVYVRAFVIKFVVCWRAVLHLQDSTVCPWVYFRGIPFRNLFTRSKSFHPLPCYSFSPLTSSLYSLFMSLIQHVPHHPFRRRASFQNRRSSISSESVPLRRTHLNTGGADRPVYGRGGKGQPRVE